VEEFLRVALAPDPILPWQTVAVSILLSFVLCMVIAYVYVVTHRGLSYSRSFTQSLVLGGIVAAVLMLAVGNNLARGIGILGTLAIIRFRSSIKDPRDMVFIFAALATGIAMGVRAFGVGIAGTVAFCGAAWLMTYAAFGSRRQYDGLIRFELPATASTEEVDQVLGRYCQVCVLVNRREVAQGQSVEHNYHVRLRDPGRDDLLVQGLAAIPGVKGINYYALDATEEV